MNRLRTKCSVRRAAQILAKSEMAVYQDVARKRIPFRKIGHRVFFFEEELMDFLNAQPGVTLEQALEGK